MKARLEAWLQARWYGGRDPGLLLLGLAAIYAVALHLRAWLYRRGLVRVHRLRVPVVVVGNRVVGGTGKTPLTIALAQHLRARGWQVGIVSRGYGRDSREPLQVRPGMSAERCGDEPLLIAQRTGLPVRVDTDRVAAAQRLVDQGCSLILADDGLQHWRLGRDLEIEVVDAARGYGNGRLLPAGPLREPAREGAALRVVNGEAKGTPAWSMRLLPQAAVPLAGGAPQPLAAFAGVPVHALAGIGHPQRFFAMLRAQGLDILEHPFPDHHGYTWNDLEFATDAVVLMTEKDAVKCAGFPLRQAWYLPVAAELPDDFYAAVDRRLAEWTPAAATCRDT